MTGVLLRCGLHVLVNSILVGAVPTAVDTANNVSYRGLYRNGIEAFLNIPYGQDTGGEHRFKPPRPYTPQPGSEMVAQSYGPSCPQPLGDELGAPLVLGNVTDTSEDCLNLNIARPKGTLAGDSLPVMVWIHGGSFWSGQNSEVTVEPDGLILESVENGLPIVHVALNYRLGVFGFARSAALESEGSENAGLRDQRLAIEWVRDNIEHFGGAADKITIAGQSTGGMLGNLGAHRERDLVLDPEGGRERKALTKCSQDCPWGCSSWHTEAASQWRSNRPSARARLLSQASPGT